MNEVKKAFINTIDIAIFIVIIFVKLISLNFALKLIDFQSAGLIVGCFGSTLLLSAILCSFKHKSRLRVFVITDIIISTILMIDLIYNRYFLDVTSIALIKQAQLVGEVKDSVKALIHIEDLIYFADLIIIIPFYKKLKNIYIDDFKYKGIVRTSLLIVFLVLGSMFTYTSVHALEKDQPGLTKTLYDKKYIVRRVGDFNFHMIDFYRYVSRNVLNKDKLSQVEKDTINKWFKDKNTLNSKQKYSNSMAGKNLIVVQLEAFQGFVLNKSINGQEITPNLNKLAKESMVFDNYHYQTAWGGTSDAEFLSNVSLLPAREGSVYYQYAGNTYDSIPLELKDKGYSTVVMHANRPGFWNRTNMYKTLGFDKFENETTYNIDDVQGMGLSDKSFFKQSVEKLKVTKQPFYSFMITLSSHYPYKDSQDKLKDILNVGEFEGTIMGDYLKSVKYTDEAIGEFIQELKDAGLWDNSVVVFYGDHSAIQYEKKDELAKLMYGKNDLTPLEWFNQQKVVMMMHFPGDSIKGENSMTAGQMDLFPTLANLYGMDTKYALGRDLLNSRNGFVVTRDGNWADNYVVYLKSIDKVVDIRNGKELSKDDYKDDFQRAYTYLKNSDGVIENNLIKYFNGNKK